MIDPKTIVPMKDRILVKYLEELGPKPLVELIRIKEPAAIDAISVEGDYRRLIRRAQVVARGPGARDEDGTRIPTTVMSGLVVYVTQWDDFEGRIPGHALIREADIALIEE